MIDLKVEQRAALKFIHLMKKCHKGNLPFDLSVADIKRLQRVKTCHYTGKPLFDKHGDFIGTFDRVQPDKGYVKGNVVMCTHRINSAKADLSLEELQKLVKAMEKLL